MLDGSTRVSVPVSSEQRKSKDSCMVDTKMCESSLGNEVRHASLYAFGKNSRAVASLSYRPNLCNVVYIPEHGKLLEVCPCSHYVDGARIRLSRTSDDLALQSESARP